MTYDVTLTPQAKQDLKAIYRYIAVDLASEINANRLLDRLEKTFLNWTQCRSVSAFMIGNHGAAETCA